MSGALWIFGLVVAIAAGWFGPTAFLDMRRRHRFEQIEKELPELIDILVVTVEAGVAFTQSLRVASTHVSGPLGQELRLTLQEQSMGLSTTEALKNTLVRADTPGMRIFVRSIVQGEMLGVSIGQVMRNLALEMRKRRRQAIEEKAQKAPIKMLFPLIFLIFPSIFVVHPRAGDARHRQHPRARLRYGPHARHADVAPGRRPHRLRVGAGRRLDAASNARAARPAQPATR